MIYTIEMLRPRPELALHAGNLVIVESSDAHLTLVARPYPINFGALLGLLEDGSARFLTPQATVSELAVAVGWPVDPSPLLVPSAHAGYPRPGSVRRLRRLK